MDVLINISPLSIAHVRPYVKYMSINTHNDMSTNRSMYENVALSTIGGI
jgi:hypothetical protein